MTKTLRNIAICILKPNGKVAFVKSSPRYAQILDVGCGNDAVINIKKLLPDCHYTGLDVGDYNQGSFSKLLIDKYIIVAPDIFAEAISSLGPIFDSIISSHNLEHCDDRDSTLSSMMFALKPGGRLYMSFPSSRSIYFPKRKGTLNYYDDLTHQGQPPNYDSIISSLQKNNFVIEFATRHYQPLVMRLLGLILEPLSALQKRVLKGTWEFYGFESIIVARKLV